MILMQGTGPEEMHPEVMRARCKSRGNGGHPEVQRFQRGCMQKGKPKEDGGPSRCPASSEGMHA
eukprot:1156737-Pelagomonas_calceolata.AAC.10